jgi:diadenosine tetraphosphate (Ap4A) HIT family hydrolase
MERAGCMACDANAGRLKAPGGVVYEDRLWRVEHALSPALLRGWLILKTRRHVEHLGELTLDEASALGPLVQRFSGAVQRALAAERVYVCSFGELVNHVHFYILPRYADMPRSGLEVLRLMFGSEAPFACSDDVAAAAAERVRAALS